jgi:hypothetical protein
MIHIPLILIIVICSLVAIMCFVGMICAHVHMMLCKLGVIWSVADPDPHHLAGSGIFKADPDPAIFAQLSCLYR